MNVFKTIAIYGAFIFRAFSFILLLPLFARIIEPSVWGGILAAQSLATWLAVFLDFGFTTFLIRKIAFAGSDRATIGKSIGEVYSAKLLLLLISAVICYLTTLSGILSHYPSFAWMAFLLALVQGAAPLWYYQATEKMYFYSVIDIIGRILYMSLSILLIKKNSEAYLVLGFQILGTLVVNFITLPRLWREIGGFSLSWRGALSVLREGIALSGFSLLTSVYTTASTFLFGLFASPASVSVYGNADKIIRSGTSLLIIPLSQILVPKSIRAFSESAEMGFLKAKKFLLIYLSLSIMGLVVGWIVSPWAIEIVFGKQYALTAVYFRWLLILLPLTSINTVLVNHILIPMNHEVWVVKSYAVITSIAILLIFILVPKFDGQGMIFSVLVPEILVMFLLMFGIYRVRR